VVYFRLEARCSQPDWREALDTVEHQDDPAVFSRLLTNCGQAPQKTFWGRSCTFIADYPLSDIFGYKKLTFSLRSADHPSFDLELFGPLDEPAFLQKMEAGAKLIREKQYTIGITKLMEPARLPDWVISQSQPRSAVWLF
jgi:hypothetical protein